MSQPRREDFIWRDTDVSHFSRRAEMLKKYPQIQKLFGIEPSTKYIVSAVVLLQLCVAWYFGNSDSFKSWPFWVAAYVIGGTCNHLLFLTFHELSHGLAFKNVRHNLYFSMFVANVPIAIPAAALYCDYHPDHHKFLGTDGVDPDLPTQLEARFLSSTLGKAIFASFQIVFYALRPLLTHTKPVNRYQLVNAAYIFCFDALLCYFCGLGALFYFIASDFFAGSCVHPCAAHFIAEHYVFDNDYETYSYYGILNVVSLNAGYHNEHHDFPNIPWTRLPRLREIAPEYYNNRPCHSSWPLVSLQFVFGPSLSVWSRVKRHLKTM